MSWVAKAPVVVPIDFSRHSIPAIRTGLELSSEPLNVHVIHVLMGSSDRDLLHEWDQGSADDSWDEAGRQRLGEFLKSHDIPNVVQDVCLGDPGFAIADYVRQHRASLIVIPSHGLQGIKRLLLGSVADRVIHYASCPVLVLRCDLSE